VKVVPQDEFQWLVILSEVDRDRWSSATGLRRWGGEASNAVEGSALKIALQHWISTLLRTVVLNVVKDPRLYFHGFGWNTVPCRTAVVLGPVPVANPLRTSHNAVLALLL
jgi:hypothetical protein